MAVELTVEPLVRGLLKSDVKDAAEPSRPPAGVELADGLDRQAGQKKCPLPCLSNVYKPEATKPKEETR